MVSDGRKASAPGPRTAEAAIRGHAFTGQIQIDNGVSLQERRAADHPALGTLRVSCFLPPPSQATGFSKTPNPVMAIFTNVPRLQELGWFETDPDAGRRCRLR